MENQINQEKKPALKTFLKAFSLIMALVYIAVGLWFLLSARQSYVVPHVHVLPLGFILVAYGLYRAYVNYKKFFKQPR